MDRGKLQPYRNFMESCNLLIENRKLSYQGNVWAYIFKVVLNESDIKPIQLAYDGGLCGKFALGFNSSIFRILVPEVSLPGGFLDIFVQKYTCDF